MNARRGPAVHQVGDGKEKVPYVWQGADDPQGQHIITVPDEVAADLGIRRSVKAGVLLEISQEEAEAFHDRAVEATVSSIGEQEKKVLDALDRSHVDTTNQYVVVPCVGPNPQGGVCAAQVTMQVAMMATEPPLCPSHAHLAPSYSLVANATGFGWTKTR
jgi:hypothetical protein